MSLHIDPSSNYEDRDGSRKTFTTIDWSPKTSIGTLSPIDLAAVTKQLSAYRAEIIKKIVNINPYYVNPSHISFIKRGDIEKLEWHIDMLLDPGLDIDFLRNMLTLLENSQELDREF